MGFTLVELLTTVVVLAILASIAAASMNSTLSNNGIYSIQNELVASLALARSEAARRGVAVYVRASAPASGNTFGGGWSVCVDADGDGTCDADSSAVLRTHDAAPWNVQVRSSTTAVGFNPMGFVTPAGSVELDVCAKDGSVGGYSLTIQPNGMVDVAEVAPLTPPCSAS